MAKLTRGAALIVVAVVSFTGCRNAIRSSATTANPTITAAIQAKTPPPFVARDRHARDVWEKERRFYNDRGLRLVWSDGEKPASSVDALRRAIERAADEGLDAADYRIAAANQSQFDRLHAADFDLQLTYAYLSYAADLAFGAARPEDLNPEWHAARRDVDIVGAIERGIDENRIEESIALGDRIIVLTPRPARIRDIIRVDIPRPRTVASAIADPRFVELRDRCWREFPRGAARPAC